MPNFCFQSQFLRTTSVTGFIRDSLRVVHRSPISVVGQPNGVVRQDTSTATSLAAGAVGAVGGIVFSPGTLCRRRSVTVGSQSVGICALYPTASLRLHFLAVSMTPLRNFCCHVIREKFRERLFLLPDFEIAALSFQGRRGTTPIWIGHDKRQAFPNLFANLA